jgi:phosphate transport system permease protein
MNITTILLIIGLLGVSAYYTGIKKSLVLREEKLLHSTPIYHGAILAVNSSLASILFIIIWLFFEKNIFLELSSLRYILFTISILIFIFTAVITFKKIKHEFKARDKLEKIIELFLLACSTLAILVTIGIVLSVIFESNRFFSAIPISDFLFGTHWSPQMPIREDQAGSAGAFGAVPLFTGTFLIAFIAMCIAGPIGLMSAIYLSEYASKKVRDIVKPLTEILAGIPTVVYGFFAVVVVAPFIRDTGNHFD